MGKLLNWLKKLDGNLVKILLIGFIFFVPLWPKLPFKMVNYTYIAIRFDDIYLAILAFIFLIQLLRKKVSLNKKFILPFTFFLSAVFISFFWNAYVSKNIEIPNLGLLHSLRRVEYMIMFFIASSVIKTKKDFWQVISYFFISVLLVILYGLGQKFLNFPAVQTMNPEYAKGYILYLTPEARISSTFGGHYDLAIYLVMAIPVILSFYFAKEKNSYLYLFIGALLILLYTSSRSSFIAYFVATVAFLLFIRKFKFLIFVLILTTGLMFTTGEITKRFLKTFQVRRILVDERTGAVYIGQTITTKELPAGSFYVKLKGQSGDNLDIFRKQVVQEKLREATLSGEISSSDKEKYMASLSANLKSINTVVSDISMATRLQVEWPRAINAFKKNLLLGTGPSSLTEATDGDYFRWLGEYGLLGTIAFLNILFLILKTVWNKIKKLSFKDKLIGYGFIFGFFALFINASYIDAFEASKVAYTFWTLSGLFIGYFNLSKT
ncbi:MAG: O-antigen ligase family protein [Candidatus Roizmanbacteria bacterium]|nr:O-antigen ligase family protein [Candidatus Roizmanbacteria bacterium]